MNTLEMTVREVYRELEQTINDKLTDTYIRLFGKQPTGEQIIDMRQIFFAGL